MPNIPRVSFKEIMRLYKWEPITGCPGRFILKGSLSKLLPEDIVCHPIKSLEYRVTGARDTVIVTRFDDGGLISYKRENSTYVHTLNTPEGLERKLYSLGILPVSDDSTGT